MEEFFLESRPLMTDAPVVRKALFDEKVCTYWVLTGVLTLLCTIVLAPLILLWLPLGHVLTKRYLARMSCVLTERQLLFKKGYFIRVEKTVPLDRITDLGVIQGPIMRHFGLWRLTIETAGQSGAGALLSMTGIIDARGYREKVLQTRDALVDGAAAAAGGAAEATPVRGGGGATNDGQSSVGSDALLTDVRDTLNRIETLLRDRS